MSQGTATEAALEALGKRAGVRLEVRNLFDQSSERFDAIVVSEVLEHLEDPVAAVRALGTLLNPDGLLYVNVPINSPAPDHIYLLTATEDAVALIEDNGFVVTEAAFFPATNYTIEQARRHKLTISVCLIAKKR